MKKKILIFSSIIILTIVTFMGIYLNTYYKATEKAYDYLNSSESVSVFKDKNGYYTFMPEDPHTAIIFYPGGKVESLAYAPLLHELSKEGYLVILVNMPFNLAIFNVHAANKVKTLYSDIDNWYIAGHSLGGSMAASHISKNSNEYKGLILLASYSTSDLSNTNLKVLSIYGTNDQVINKEKYETNKSNLSNLEEYIIDGGNHANFAYYGHQKGDGDALIPRESQIQYTIQNITNFIGESNE